MKRWFVLISYGEPSAALIEYATDRCRAYGLDLMNVRTDRGAGRYVVQLNMAFEFSGYEEARRVIVASAPEDAGDDLQIIFANDTFFSAHLRVYVNALFERLARPLPAGALIGTTHAVPGANQEFVSTWMFGLHAPRAVFEQLAFFECKQLEFRERVWPGLPDAYRTAIDTWLNPRGLFHGWYKAIPGKPLSWETLWRKRFSIYLEHDLSRKAARLGIRILDVSACLDAFGGRRMRVWRFLDRAYVNMLKLRLRLLSIAGIDGEH